MYCIILAAGYATRLYPLTENFPKPLLPVKGKAILDWLVDDIGDIKYAVVTNHKFAHHFEEWAAKRPEDILVVDDGTETNETRLGAVRDMRLAAEKMGLDDDVLVIAGDNLLDFSLRDFTAYAQRKGTSCIMRYYEPDEAHLKKCGVLSLAEDDLVTEMAEKPSEPKSHWCCPPFYYYKAEDIAMLPTALEDGCGADAPGSFAAWMVAHRPVHAFEMPAARHDIGNLESYQRIDAEWTPFSNK